MKVTGVMPPSPGEGIRVIVESTAVAVFNVGGQLLGVGADCTHVGGPWGWARSLVRPSRARSTASNSNSARAP